MRSRMARMHARVSALAAGTVLGATFTGAAYAAPEEDPLAAAGGALEALSAPVGLAAVGFGVTGMVAGVLRRKKTPVQPQNRRK
ncbi:hypothetical protein [Allosaccharopolyspora coralli]|uniref:hypothetical protein n=1 Tax=Allosaccharopolyspora coralli TaxID=2665642 RepID=UPI001651E0F0|nr:hypothetical protein [Allosaccharopolyspora coralli]